MDSSLPVANPHRSDRLDASLQCNIGVAADGLISSCLSIHTQNFACTSFAQLPNFANMCGSVALHLTRPTTFF